LKIHCQHDKKYRQLFGIFDETSQMRFDEFITLP